MFILPLIDTPSKESERTVPMGIRISICGSSHGQEVKRHREAFCLSPVHSLGNQSIGKRPITQAMSHRVEPRPKSCALKLASLFSTICPKIHIADNDNNDGYNGQCQLHVCQASHSTGEHPPTCPGGDRRWISPQSDRKKLSKDRNLVSRRAMGEGWNPTCHHTHTYALALPRYPWTPG